MKRFVVITLALVAGGLVSSAQDGDASELRREIERLTEKLRRRADAARGARAIDAVPTMRMYDVSDLTERHRDRTLADLPNLRPSKYQPPEPRELSEPQPIVEIDALIEMMRIGVEPESWDTIEGAYIEPRNNRLLIKTLPRIHAKIERFLAWRRGAVRRVAVEVAAVALEEGDRARVDAARRELPPALARELLSRGVLASLSFAGLSGQQLADRNGRTLRFVQDYDVEIAQGADIGDPITREVFLGLAAEVVACLSGDDHALVHARIGLTTLDGEIATQPTQHGPLELPRIDLTRTSSNFAVPLGRTVVAGGGTIDGRSVVFLVTVRQR